MCVQHYSALHSPTHPIVLFILPFLHFLQTISRTDPNRNPVRSQSPAEHGRKRTYPLLPGLTHPYGTARCTARPHSSRFCWETSPGPSGRFNPSPAPAAASIPAATACNLIARVLVPNHRHGRSLGQPPPPPKQNPLVLDSKQPCCCTLEGVRGGEGLGCGEGSQGGGACVRPSTTTCIPPGGMCICIAPRLANLALKSTDGLMKKKH